MKKIAALFILALGWTSVAQGAVTVDSTRVVIEAGEKENSVLVTSSPGSTVLLQSWTSSKDGEEIPFFTAAPPMALVKENTKQRVNIIYQGAGAPSDRETVLYLNLQDSAAMAAESQNKSGLTPSFLQVLKIFYRPPALKNKDPLEAALGLKWEVKGKAKNGYIVKVENPSPFNIVFSGILLSSKRGNAAGSLFSTRDADMLEPFSSAEYVVNVVDGGNPSGVVLDKLVYLVIDDFGMSNAFFGTISENSVLSITKAEKEKTPETQKLEKIEFDTAPTNHGVDLESLVG